MTANPIINFQALPRPRRLQPLKELLLDQQPGEHMVMTNVSWEDYDQLSQFRDDNRKSVRLAFAAGDLEVMTITFQHENYGKILAILVDMACLVKKLPRKSAGSMTVRREDLVSGFEPDTSYYIQNFSKVIPIRELDFSIDPPPDLAIEVELNQTIEKKLTNYATIGVPEIWRCDGEQVVILKLDNHLTYIPVTTSDALQDVTVDDLNRFFQRGIATDETTLSPWNG